VLTSSLDNQWQVDFNISLSSFEPQIAGVAKLIALSSASSTSPPIFFTSSIGTVRFWNDKHPNEVVPETAVADPSAPEHQGYSESKWIAERRLDAAAKNCGVSSAICRVAQIAGPVEKGVKGAWNIQEWLPSVSGFRESKLFLVKYWIFSDTGTDNH
jgi:thioester reductase-like protein